MCPWCSSSVSCRVRTKAAFIWVLLSWEDLFELLWCWFRIFWRRRLRQLKGDDRTFHSWEPRKYHWYFWSLLFWEHWFFRVLWVDFCWNWWRQQYWCFIFFRDLRVMNCCCIFSYLLLAFLGMFRCFCSLLRGLARLILSYFCSRIDSSVLVSLLECGSRNTILLVLEDQLWALLVYHRCKL